MFLNAIYANGLSEIVPFAELDSILEVEYESNELLVTTSSVKEAVTDADVVMGLRIQFERQKTVSFPGLAEYRELFGVNPEILKYAKKDVLVMHPGPVNRGIEFTTEVVDGKNSVINIQVKNGVAVRMAILKLLMTGGK